MICCVRPEAISSSLVSSRWRHRSTKLTQTHTHMCCVRLCTPPNAEFCGVTGCWRDLLDNALRAFGDCDVQGPVVGWSVDRPASEWSSVRKFVVDVVAHARQRSSGAILKWAGLSVLFVCLYVLPANSEWRWLRPKLRPSRSNPEFDEFFVLVAYSASVRGKCNDWFESFCWICFVSAYCSYNTLHAKNSSIGHFSFTFFKSTLDWCTESHKSL